LHPPPVPWPPHHFYFSNVFQPVGVCFFASTKWPPLFLSLIPSISTSLSTSPVNPRGATVLFASPTGPLAAPPLFFFNVFQPVGVVSYTATQWPPLFHSLYPMQLASLSTSPVNPRGATVLFSSPTGPLAAPPLFFFNVLQLFGVVSFTITQRPPLFLSLYPMQLASLSTSSVNPRGATVLFSSPTGTSACLLPFFLPQPSPTFSLFSLEASICANFYC
jgi:hypothetical protein